MKNRWIPLIALAAVLATLIAPPAMADHCQRCRVTTTSVSCFPATTGGYQSCTVSGGTCVLSGTCGGPHPFIEIEEPFGADFEVASVERLDEPQQPKQDETRVASLETPAPAAHR